MRNRAGEFLGSVKGVIPVDASRVLYEYIKNTDWEYKIVGRTTGQLKTYVAELSKV